MEQQPLTQRLIKVRERCMEVSGGIKAVARTMGKAENTLHNWFKGNTTPTVGDVELLVRKLEQLEANDRIAKEAEEKRLNAALA